MKIHPLTKIRFKKFFKQFKETLFFSAFAMFLPGVLFAGFAAIIVSFVGLKEVITLPIIFAYGAACGGYWIGVYVTKVKIEKCYYSNKTREEMRDVE